MALNDVPLSSQSLADSQNPIRQNFKTYIEPNFAVDHIGFNTGADSGYHLKITLPAPADSTIPAVPANGATLFWAEQNPAFDQPGVATYPTTTAFGVINLRVDGIVPVIPINYGGTQSALEGFTFLPSGVVLKWETVSMAPLATVFFPFAVGASIPVFTSVFTAQISPIMVGGQSFSTTGLTTFIVPYVSALSSTGITITSPGTSDSNPFNLSYLVIGVAV
jgi:hypothetical protein